MMIFRKTALVSAVATALISSPAMALDVSLEQDANELANILTGVNSGVTVNSAEILYGSPCDETGCFSYGGVFSLRDISDPFQGPVPTSSGIYTNTSGTYNLPSKGIVLSTGNAEDYGAGINNSSWPESDIGNTTNFNNRANPSQLELLGPITQTGGGFVTGIGNDAVIDILPMLYDVTQLNIDFDVHDQTDTLSFLAAFGSEEFPLYFMEGFNDGFGIYLNGENFAGVMSDDVLLPINKDHPEMMDIEGTELNGVLAPNENPLLRFDVPVEPGSTGNTLSMIIADAGDTEGDSTVYIASQGSSELIPIMPSNGEPDENGAFNFEIAVGDDGLGIDNPIWIDPIVAIGYTYETTGLNFTSVTLPSLASVNDTDGYDVWYFNGTELVLGAREVQAGDTFDFTSSMPNGVDEFQILDIDPTLELDPNNPNAFMTGVTFTGPGTANVSMTPITFDTDANEVPVPATLPLFFFGGLGWLMVAARRRA